MFAYIAVDGYVNVNEVDEDEIFDAPEHALCTRREPFWVEWAGIRVGNYRNYLPKYMFCLWTRILVAGLLENTW